MAKVIDCKTRNDDEKPNRNLQTDSLTSGDHRRRLHYHQHRATLFLRATLHFCSGVNIYAKVKLAEMGFSIGGEPPYGFARWLCDANGDEDRELGLNEVVKRPGYHVVWLPTREDELAVVRRIYELALTTPVDRIARILIAEKIPSPNAGRFTTKKGKRIVVSGAWWPNTVKSILTHPLYRGMMTYGARASGDQLRYTPDGPRALMDADFNECGKPRVVWTAPDLRFAKPIPTKMVSAIQIDLQQKVERELTRRSAHLKGKPRTRKNNPNPLGARIFDSNCGWSLYRLQRRDKWLYRCGLYEASEAKCCSYNYVDGPKTTAFVLAAIRQKILTTDIFNRLKSRLRELAYNGSVNKVTEMQRSTFEASRTKIESDLRKVERNFAHSETDEERTACRRALTELKGERDRIEKELARLTLTERPLDPEAEVQAAVSVLDRLATLSQTPDSDYTLSTELIKIVNAKLYLDFENNTNSKRRNTKVAGGVLTFGDVPPPVPLYDGPTGRAIITKMLAEGRPVSTDSGQRAPESSSVEAIDVMSGNMQRLTRRWT